MLERLFLAGTVTCLLYVSFPFGQSSVNPTRTNQPASYVKIEGLPMSNFHDNQDDLRI
jgi:hypothetical protein